MKCKAVWGVIILAFTITGYGSSKSPTAPSSPGGASTPPPPVAFSGSLSGTINSAAGGGIGGATLRVVDGPNTGREVGTDGNGRYELTGLQQAGFTAQVSHPNFVGTSRGFTVSPQAPSATGNFTLLPATL